MDKLESALIATDFSEEAGWATHRAALIAGETGAHGVLVHVLPASLPVDTHVAVAPKAQNALLALAEELHSQGVRFEPRLLSGDVDAELARVAADFDLAVAGAHGGNALLDFALGRSSVNLVRDNQRPTLIVKRPPHGPYRQVVVAVDFSESSRAAAAFGPRVAPQADFDFVNAYEVEFESTMRFAGTREELIERYRVEARTRATAAMEQFVQAVAVHDERISTVVMRGYPARVILDHAQRIGAELIVIGKSSADVVERLLIASVALQVLEAAPCDVLVVPQAVR